MPIIPSTWSTNIPITAHQLNQDLYTYDGSYFGANGVMFHANRPILFETYLLSSNILAAKGGSTTLLGGSQGSAISVIDNAALFGVGSDFPGDAASFQSSGAIGPGSNGVAGQYGGWNLIFAFVPVSAFSGTVNTIGVIWSLNQAPATDIGCITQGATARNNCGFAVDLVQRISGLGTQAWAPAVACADPSGASRTIVANTTTTTGTTPRFGEIWMAVSNGNGLTVPSIPSPLTVVTTATTFSAATLNTSIQQTFNLLNNPPMLNAQLSASGTIPANTITNCPFTVTPLIDNYSGYSTANTNYIVPLSGMYFVHANIIYAQSFNTGQAVAGIKVNGTNYFGGAYNATPVAAQNTGASVTKVMDLQAGDTVSTVTVTSAGTNFGTANVSHFIMTWMSPISTVSNLNWDTPDVTGFQFQAASPPDNVAVLNSNPYFTGASATGWVASQGSITASGSPPSGSPYPNALQYINNGISSGCAVETNAQFALNGSSQYIVDAWVWSTTSVVQVGFDFRDNAHNYLITEASNFTVPVNTWVAVSSTQPTYPGARYGVPRVGTSTGNGATVWTTGVVASSTRPLTPLMNQKLANDINFLLNKPYLTVHQSTAQTGLVINSSTNVTTFQATTGLVHGSVGDNYGGWNAANQWYVAPVNGWYFSLLEINAATTSTANSGNSIAAMLRVRVSGGVTAPSTPDVYQNLMVSNAWTYPTGATAMGIYYLLAGETIQPAAFYAAGSGTWSTDVTHNFLSHFNVFWLSN